MMIEPVSREIPSVRAEHWRTDARAGQPQRTPLIISGALLGTRAVQWTPQRLASTYADVTVGVSLNLPKSGVPYTSSAQSHRTQMRVADFVPLLDQGGSSYMDQVSLTLFPEVLRDIGFEEELHVPGVRSLNLWVGTATRSGLHFDAADNVFAQLHGTKRVVLIAPRFSRHLYVFPDSPSKSQVDPENPDPRRFPQFDRIERLQSTLSPGDLLYIPKGWWHYLAADAVSMSANCWHGPSFTRLESTRSFLHAAGVRGAMRWSRDFVWHGILNRPFERRLFSPPPLGLRSYRALQSSLQRITRRSR